MWNEKHTNGDNATHKVKPEGNPDPAMPHTPDVMVEGWSAEEIAEESSYLDGTEVKEEMEEGKWVKRENRDGHVVSPPSFDHKEGDHKEGDHKEGDHKEGDHKEGDHREAQA